MHASAMPANIYTDFGTAHHQAVWQMSANLGPGIRGLKFTVIKLQILCLSKLDVLVHCLWVGAWLGIGMALTNVSHVRYLKRVPMGTL